MRFNSDPFKQAQKVIFTRKVKKFVHPPIFFHNETSSTGFITKTLGPYIRRIFKVYKYIKTIKFKVSKTINLLRKFKSCLPRSSLTTIYTSFERPHLDYGDVIFDKSYNTSFQQRLESLQDKVPIAIIGAIKGSSTEKLYKQL